jgi:hypothetical protein
MDLNFFATIGACKVFVVVEELRFGFDPIRNQFVFGVLTGDKTGLGLPIALPLAKWATVLELERTESWEQSN